MVTANAMITQNPGCIDDVYELGEQIGEGGSSRVFRGIHRKTRESRAIKVTSVRDRHAMRQATTELELLKTTDHPNLIRAYEWFEDSRFHYTVLEYMRGGELFEEILTRGTFREHNVAHIIKQVLSCLVYFHKKGIVHRDIRAENIMLENRCDFDLIKLIDFGSALKMKTHDPLRDKVGTPYYVAPEVLKGAYARECDMWSLGVLTYILLTGSPPFNA